MLLQDDRTILVSAGLRRYPVDRRPASIAIAAASRNVDFALRSDHESSATGNLWIELECTGETVYFHGAYLDIGVYHPEGGDLALIAGVLEVLEPQQVPARLHRAEYAHLAWIGRPVDLKRCVPVTSRRREPFVAAGASVGVDQNPTLEHSFSCVLPLQQLSAGDIPRITPA